VKYRFILGLKKLLLLKSISQFTKKRKQTNRQTNKEKEKRKQAYARIDLGLNDSQLVRLSTGGTSSESDHELIGQVGTRSVGGIRARATSLIMLNHYSSRFRLSIPNLKHRFDKSQTLTTFP